LRGAQILAQDCVQASVEKGIEALFALPGLFLLQTANVFQAVFRAPATGV
jgi:hypothetical protein